MTGNELFLQEEIPSAPPLIRSQYLRRTALLQEAGRDLCLPGGERIRRMPDREAVELRELLRKRNVFARHSRENSFYLERAMSLGGLTVIEVQADGDPNQAMAGAAIKADLLETLAVLSTILATRRTALQRLLGITVRPAGEVDLIYSGDLHYVRSHNRSSVTKDGIPINERFVRRFQRLGFTSLYDYCQESTSLSSRVQSTLNWLLESRKESNAHGAIVKSVIALETLLISSESEPLTRTLSERMAFLLGETPQERRLVSRLVRRIYTVRSSIVHGSKKKLKGFSEALLESLDRLVILSCLTIARNKERWSTIEDICEWCETERWSAPSLQATSPFPHSYLQRALELGEKRPRKDACGN